MKIDAEQQRFPQPDARPLGKNRWVLEQAYTIHRVTSFTIPAHFICDGASVGLGTLLIPKGGLIEGPAFVHDWMYRHNGAADKCGGTEYNRLEADLAFYTNMLRAGMHDVSAWIAFRAVRWFGRKPWHAHAKRIREEPLYGIERKADDGGDA